MLALVVLLVLVAAASPVAAVADGGGGVPSRAQWSTALATELGLDPLPPEGHAVSAEVALTYGRWECPPWVAYEAYYADPLTFVTVPAGWVPAGGGSEHRTEWRDWYALVGAAETSLASADAAEAELTSRGAFYDGWGMWNDIWDGTYDPEAHDAERAGANKTAPGDPGYAGETWDELMAGGGIVEQIYSVVDDAYALITVVWAEMSSGDPFGFRRFMSELMDDETEA